MSKISRNSEISDGGHEIIGVIDKKNCNHEEALLNDQ